MIPEMQTLMVLLDSAFEEAQSLLRDVSIEQLNWRPMTGESRAEMTSSLYGLTLHLAFVAIKGANRVMGHPAELSVYPEASAGNNGIALQGTDVERALHILAKARSETRQAAETLTTAQLEELRARDFGEPQTARWMMWHILEHTMLHIGHMQLTRQLVLRADLQSRP
jgi:hypothetical protein